MLDGQLAEMTGAWLSGAVNGMGLAHVRGQARSRGRESPGFFDQGCCFPRSSTALAHVEHLGDPVQAAWILVSCLAATGR